jgi:hypothetical protein
LPPLPKYRPLGNYNYAVHLDFENLWIQNQRLALPSLTPGPLGTELGKNPELMAKLVAQLQRFPEVLLNVIRGQFEGRSAREVVATAVWPRLFYSRTASLSAVLPSLGIRMIDPPTASARDMKNASDFTSMATLLKTLFQSGNDDVAIVIGCGDHAPVHFAELILDQNRDILFTSFATNTSALIHQLAQRRPDRVTYLSIEQAAEYRKYFIECAKIDPVQQRLLQIPVSQLVEATAIFKLWYAWSSRKNADHHYKPFEELFRQQWLPGWLSYWQQYELMCTGENKIKFEDEAYWFDYLVNTGVIRVSWGKAQKGSRAPQVSLVAESELVKRMIAEIEAQESLYKLRYHVAQKAWGN